MWAFPLISAIPPVEVLQKIRNNPLFRYYSSTGNALLADRKIRIRTYPFLDPKFRRFDLVILMERDVAYRSTCLESRLLPGTPPPMHHSWPRYSLVPVLGKVRIFFLYLIRYGTVTMQQRWPQRYFESVSTHHARITVPVGTYPVPYASTLFMFQISLEVYKKCFKRPLRRCCTFALFM